MASARCRYLWKSAAVVVVNAVSVALLLLGVHHSSVASPSSAHPGGLTQHQFESLLAVVARIVSFAEGTAALTLPALLSRIST